MPTQADLVKKVATADSGGYFCEISNMWTVSKPTKGPDVDSAMQFLLKNIKMGNKQSESQCW